MGATRPPSGWAPEPGTTWVGRSGAMYVTTRLGFLARAGEDDPAAVWEPKDVWATDGPLVPAPGLAAHLRREAHEVQCVDGAADCATVRADAAAVVDRLLDRADRLAS